MRHFLPSRRGGRAFGLVTCAGLLAGCGGGPLDPFGGNPFPYGGGGTVTGPGTAGRTTGGITTGAGGSADPCTLSQAQKLVRISMRNMDSTDYVHYFLVLIAFVNGTTYPNGAVCANDIAFYTAFGYTSVAEGSAVEFGNYCIQGPALYYFHRGGQFAGAGGTGASSLASAIAPAQGSTPTYDNFFGSAGAPVPVPNVILFHNPGTTAEGQALKISRNTTSPCSPGVVVSGDPDCQQDAFYYVDETDRISGSTALGLGSGRRVPSEIQGTGCQCAGQNAPFSSLALSGTAASTAGCSQFFRGGRIDYVFVRDDRDPPYPQLLWRVTDSGGAMAHDFDPRAGIQ